MVVIMVCGENGSRKVESVPLGKAIDELLEAKRRANLRPDYITSLRQYLAMFSRGRENEMVGSFDVEDLEDWFASRGESASTRASNTGRLASLFAFSKRRGWVEENPAERLEPVNIERKAPLILTVDQCRALLSHAKSSKPHALAWLALTLFCGLRPVEASRATWNDIDLDAGTVTVRAEASKTHQRRVVHLLPMAVTWLRFAKYSGGMLPCCRATRQRWLRAFRVALAIPAWPQDILRHTCATHWLANTGDAGKVATELGNSARILIRHYREIVPEKETVAFWNLLPEVEWTRMEQVCPEIQRP